MSEEQADLECRSQGSTGQGRHAVGPCPAAAAVRPPHVPAALRPPAAHLRVQQFQLIAEVGREEVVACGRPLPPLDEGGARSLKCPPAAAARWGAAQAVTRLRTAAGPRARGDTRSSSSSTQARPAHLSRRSQRAREMPRRSPISGAVSTTGAKSQSSTVRRSREAACQRSRCSSRMLAACSMGASNSCSSFCGRAAAARGGKGGGELPGAPWPSRAAVAEQRQWWAGSGRRQAEAAGELSSRAPAHLCDGGGVAPGETRVAARQPLHQHHQQRLGPTGLQRRGTGGQGEAARRREGVRCCRRKRASRSTSPTAARQQP